MVKNTQLRRRGSILMAASATATAALATPSVLSSVLSKKRISLDLKGLNCTKSSINFRLSFREGRGVSNVASGVSLKCIEGDHRCIQLSSYALNASCHFLNTSLPPCFHRLSGTHSGCVIVHLSYGSIFPNVQNGCHRF